MRISKKRQVSIPKKVMDALGLKPGDEVDFEIERDSAKIIPIKTIKVPRDQAWFWSETWQQKEKEAEKDITTGNYKEYKSVKDLLEDLHREV